MSKPLYLIICVVAGLFAFHSAAPAAELTVKVVVDPGKSSAVVSGRFKDADAAKNLGFLRSAIGAADLGKRISELELKNAAGTVVEFRPFTSSEFVANTAFTSFTYRLDLTPVLDPRSAAHASWLTAERGLFFVDDLVPLLSRDRTADFELQVPEAWQIATTEPASAKGGYAVGDVSRAVFVAGRSIRRSAGSVRPAVAVSGTWQFADSDISESAREIFARYRTIFGSDPARPVMVAVLPFPGPAAAGTWEAETRGSTVVVLSADTTFKGQSLQRLHEQLRHELFHLWLPNAVALTGPYDWFYEGFALYTSLKTAVSLNRIRFDDYLDTLSRAYAIDNAGTTRRSALELSAVRLNGSETLLYARGMLIAFAWDLELLANSNGKRSAESVLNKVFSGHRRPMAPSDGNEAVLKIARSYAELGVDAERFVKGIEPFDWPRLLEKAGLDKPAAAGMGIRVKPKLTGPQKAVLDKLGYNSWRKLVTK